MKNIREIIQNYKINHIKKELMMKVAVPITNGNQIDDHFGHCEFYKVFTISENDEISNTEIIPSPQGCGCKSNIAAVLAAKGVSIMLAGGMGEGAVNVLKNSGIQVVRGCSGDATEVVETFIEGNIFDNGISCSRHHQHNGDGPDHVCSH